jgi:hypothetical protein
MGFIISGCKAKASCSFFFLFIFATICFTDSSAQINARRPFYLKAKLVNSKNNESVVFANIINSKTLSGAISDESGFFIIMADQGDMLQITSIGYQPKMFLVTDSMRFHFYVTEIKLYEKVYELGNVDVHFLGTYQEFKYRMLHTSTKDPFAKVNRKLQKEIDSLLAMPTNDLPTFPLGSPITMLYNLFSKEGKELRKYIDAVEKQPNENIIHAKFNRQLLEDITGLKGEELNEFLLKYRPSDNYILSASEYDLHEKILQSLEEYKKKKKQATDKK